MEYQDKLKEVFANISGEAQLIMKETLKLEAAKRWQEEHKGLGAELVDEIQKVVESVVKS